MSLSLVVVVVSCFLIFVLPFSLSFCRGGGEFKISLFSENGGLVNLFGSTWWPPPVESPIAVEDAVERIAVSIAFLFRACFKGISDTIAPLSRG